MALAFACFAGATASAGLALEEQLAAFEARFARLEKENTELRHQLSEMQQRQATIVSPLGEVSGMGRQLSHVSGDTATCCRWTPSDTCGSVAPTKLRQCTKLHEYMEAKTTTHEVCPPTRFALGT